MKAGIILDFFDPVKAGLFDMCGIFSHNNISE
jgi:hypothetical protein